MGHRVAELPTLQVKWSGITVLDRHCHLMCKCVNLSFLSTINLLENNTTVLAKCGNVWRPDCVIIKTQMLQLAEHLSGVNS